MRNNHSIISLCAGKNTRFGGKRKYHLEVNGKTLEQRAKEQFGNVFMATPELFPNDTATCETMANTEPEWGHRTTVLLGDVYYTDEAAATIKNSDEPFAVFTDSQDIFAMAFDYNIGHMLLSYIKQVLEPPINNNGRLWELYRKFMGMKDTDTLPPKGMPFCHIIDDATQDFDWPQEYDDFINGISKNKLK